MSLSITNNTGEEIEFVQIIDTEIPGCRVANKPVPPLIIPSEGNFCMTGYEPGISYIIRPVERPEEPRTWNGGGGK